MDPSELFTSMMSTVTESNCADSKARTAKHNHHRCARAHKKDTDTHIDDAELAFHVQQRATAVAFAEEVGDTDERGLPDRVEVAVLQEGAGDGDATLGCAGANAAVSWVANHVWATRACKHARPPTPTLTTTSTSASIQDVNRKRRHPPLLRLMEISPASLISTAPSAPIIV